MSRYSLEQFKQQHAQQDRGEGLFELETQRLLEVNLNGSIWTKLGSMVSYVGEIKFVREGIFEHGIGRLFKKAISGEGTPLTKASGTGRLYLADAGKKVTILQLQNETIYVNGNDVLAFEPTVDWDIKLMKKITGMIAGGLFNVKLSGHGLVAITTHFDPITLRVTPDQPVITDPNATVAWSDGLDWNVKGNFTAGTFFGRGSGEVIQMKFTGDGWVVIQPYEEAHLQSGG